MGVRVRRMNATMRVVDGESLLTPQLLDRIVTAVMEALDAQEGDERSRRRDTRLGGAGPSCEDGDGQS